MAFPHFEQDRLVRMNYFGANAMPMSSATKLVSVAM